MKEVVAKRIKGLRELRGFSQEEIADRLHISRSAYERIENGKSQSWATHLGSLVEVFEVTPEYFVKEETQVQNNGTINTINICLKNSWSYMKNALLF
tara:strand:+ start:32 stop:322 length:291 start_codon:yes stop_codon:yes gene_type:complete